MATTTNTTTLPAPGMPASAFFLALITLLLWSFLAYFGTQLSHLPPLLVVGVALSTSGVFSLVSWRGWRVPLRTLLVGIGGIFGYHLLLFTAFHYAQAVEANLINYLWPLLIVILTPLFFPAYNLQSHHIIGALLGFFGVGLIMTAGKLQLNWGQLAGYAAAAGAALTWALYSLMTKRLPPFSTAAVGLFCLVGGLLSLGVFALSAPDLSAVKALTVHDGVFLLLSGAGPMGAAFFTWDAALKRGDPRVIGSLSYLTPLSSTLFLILFAGKTLNWVSGLAMILIVGGAFLGSRGVLLRSTDRSSFGNSL